MGRVPAGLCAVLLLAACGGEPAAVARPPSAPQPLDPQLRAGREIWLRNCKGCHELGIADAPRLGDRKAWARRIAQGPETLYRHAIDGFFGPMGTMMPPRGGNPDLSEAQVRAAVDYMVAASQ